MAAGGAPGEPVSVGRFGALDGAALVVTTVVGAGIFTVPAYVAQLAGSGLVTILLWLAGGAIAMAGALCYAELAARFPRGGAEYVYIREAFGPTVGFLSGWTSFVAGFSGAIAAAAVGCAAYLVKVLPALTGLETILALLLIAASTVVAVAGVQTSRWATNALALVVVAGILAVTVAGGLGGAGGLGSASPGGPASGALSALVPIFFTYSGWNAAAYVAGEFRDPARSVPRALIWGTLTVTALYVGLNYSLIRAMPLASIADSAAPVADVARIALGGIGSTLVTVLVIGALASSVCAMMVTGPRIYMEMSRDAALPAALGRLSARGVPATAIVAQSGWTAILVLSGTFEQIVSYTGFSIVLFSGLAVASLFVLRARAGRPLGYSVPGYPVVPAAFIALVAVMAVASFRFAPGPSVAGLLLITAGLPVRLLLTTLPRTA